jgi:hypothetical protein
MLGLQNQNQWQQSWAVASVTDTGDLQRLGALYRYPADNDFHLCDFDQAIRSAIVSSPTLTFRVSDYLRPDLQLPYVYIRTEFLTE